MRLVNFSFLNVVYATNYCVDILLNLIDRGILKQLRQLLHVGCSEYEVLIKHCTSLTIISTFYFYSDYSPEKMFDLLKKNPKLKTLILDSQVSFDDNEFKVKCLEIIPTLKIILQKDHRKHFHDAHAAAASADGAVVDMEVVVV